MIILDPEKYRGKAIMRSEYLLKEFLKRYDINEDLGFNSINYRKGAAITGKFGLDDGYKKLSNGSIEWGYVRIHTGVDRASGNKYKNIEDPIISPFHFESSKFQDFHGVSYGTLVSLISERYDFELRIAHMNKNDILILGDLRNEKPIEKNTIIGQTGNNGLGTGAHTHTEVKSLSEKSDTLELLLVKKYGSNKIYQSYSNLDIIDYYISTVKFKDASQEEIMEDWEKVIEHRKCNFINRYLYRYTDFDGTEKTRYSSQLLWNNL